MRRLLPALCLGAALPASGAPPPPDPALDELFRWGEYDSLIRRLEPAIGDPGRDSASAGLRDRADSVVHARAHLYLGVAYWASGRRDRGEEAFGRACRLDRELRLDPLYATPEMIGRFEAIAAEEREAREPASTVSADASMAADLSGGKREKPEKDGVPGHFDGGSGGRRWVWWTAGATVAVGVVAGGVYYFANREPREKVTVIPIEPGAPYPP